MPRLSLFPATRAAVAATAALAVLALAGPAAAAAPAPAAVPRWLHRPHQVLLGPAVPAPRLATTTQVSGAAIVYAESSALGIGLDVRLAGTGETFQVLPPQSASDYQDPVLSADGRRVAYTQVPPTGSGPAQVHVVNVDGTGDTAVLATATDQCTPDFKPRFDPSGAPLAPQYLLFTDDCNPSGAPSLSLVDLAAGTRTTLATNAAVGRFSPDGTRLGYVNTTNGVLTLAAADGSGAAGLGVSGTYPTISADNTRVLYEYGKYGLGADGLGVVNANGTGNRTLPTTTSTRLDATSPSWSDDGTEIFYSSAPWDSGLDRPAGNYEIYSVSAGGQYVANLTRTSAVDEYPARYATSPVPPAQPPAATYTPLAEPVRVLDTRPAYQRGSCRGAGATGLGPAASCQLVVADGTNVPAQASAVVLNLTGISPTAATYLKVFPSSAGGQPQVSNLNLNAGQVAAVQVQVAVGAGGAITVFNAAGEVHLAVDVAGYFTDLSGPPATGTYHPVAPVRIMDTRPGGYRIGNCGTLLAGATCTLDVTNRAVVPAAATAVVLNVTGIAPTLATWVKAFPAGATEPTVSMLNLASREVRANLTTVGVGGGHSVSFTTGYGRVDLAVDVAGYYTADGSGTTFHPVAPLRVLDTRYGVKTSAGQVAPLGRAGTLTALVGGSVTTSAGAVALPSGVRAVVLGVTGVGATGPTYLSVYPSDAAQRPVVSNLNLTRGAVVPNLAIVSAPPAGTLRIYNANGTTYAVVDLFGYYS